MVETLKEAYRKLRDRHPFIGTLRGNRFFFGNIRSMKINFRFLCYHQDCRRRFAAVGKKWRKQALKNAHRFKKQGYVILNPDYSPELIAAIRRTCEEMTRRNQTTEADGEPWFVNFHNSMTNIPEIARLMNDEVTETTEACFGSHFKIYSSEVYRLVPTNEEATISGLWHTDNYPPGIYKIMIYLTECDRTTGALRLHPKPSTRKMLRRGFFDRYKASRFNQALEQGGIPIEGPAGTVLLWNSNMIHRADAPKTSYRDVVAFKLVPSMEPWQEHLKRVGDRVNYETRNRQIPADPAED